MTDVNWPAWPDDYPDVDAVGAILRARTQDSHDDEVGTFTDDTRPTTDQAEKIIRECGSVVFMATGRLDDLQCTMKDTVQEGAKHWIAMLSAMLIELSFSPEQVRSDRSAYVFYKEMWDDATTGFTSLIDAVNECRGGELEPDTPGGDGAFVGNPSWAFPEDVGGMVGWQTRW
jgi:hypothetical protein